MAQAPRQHKQPSRKDKKAWRKHVDVTEIQQGLESARDEIIKGGIIAEKPSEALFTLDTTGSAAIQRAYNKVHKPLRSDQIIALRSAVPAVDTHRRSGTTDGVIERSTKRRKSNGVKPEEYERLQRRAFGGNAVVKDIINTEDVPENDLWAAVVEVGDPRFSYLEKKKPIKAPKSLKEAPISLLEGKKVMPAVTRPKAGISYNPIFHAWDELLEEEGKKEVEAERKRLRAAREEEERLAKIAAAQGERDDLQTEDDSIWEGIESGHECAEWLKKRRPERKTQAERNKIKRRKEAERKAKQLAKVKRLAQQAQQISAIARDMRENDNSRALVPAQAADSSDDEIDDRVLRRRKLGKAPLPQRPLELMLPDELEDSLRLLKPQGNLLSDRFRNIMVRGKIETRKPISQPKKARRTYTEKWTYKDFTISG